MSPWFPAFRLAEECTPLVWRTRSIQNQQSGVRNVGVAHKCPPYTLSPDHGGIAPRRRFDNRRVGRQLKNTAGIGHMQAMRHFTYRRLCSIIAMPHGQLEWPRVHSRHECYLILSGNPGVLTGKASAIFASPFTPPGNHPHSGERRRGGPPACCSPNAIRAVPMGAAESTVDGRTDRN